MERIMEVEDVKALIWQLDASLSVFQGVEWMENVGRVARLKEDFFRCRCSDTLALGAMPGAESERLHRCFDILADEAVSGKQSSAAFDTATKIISLLLPGNQGQAA